LVVHLARDIVGERLKPGDLVPSEAEIAGRFGLSKAVARESLQSLAGAGLVRIRQGKRTIVLEKSQWDALMPAVQQAYWIEGRAPELIRQLYEIRRTLETQAAVWAAERRDEEELTQLDEAVDEMRRIARTSKDTRAFLLADLRFHSVIGTAAENIVLRAVLRHFHAWVSESWSRSQAAPEDLELMMNQHARIVTAIRARDVAEAERAMEDHLQWAQQMETDRAKTAARAVPAAAGL